MNTDYSQHEEMTQACRVSPSLPRCPQQVPIDLRLLFFHDQSAYRTRRRCRDTQDLLSFRRDDKGKGEGA